jgi:hypothetical protein
VYGKPNSDSSFDDDSSCRLPLSVDAKTNHADIIKPTSSPAMFRNRHPTTNDGHVRFLASQSSAFGTAISDAEDVVESACRSTLYLSILRYGRRKSLGILSDCL